MKKRLLFLAISSIFGMSDSIAQTVDYTFVTVGCNRVDYLDTAATTGTTNSTGVSTANVYQLKRLFTEVTNMSPKPKYLFLTGDIVMGYINDTVALARQLSGWRSIFNNHAISTSGIQVVVIPGNHETQDKAAGKKSFVAAERTFLREMSQFIIASNGPGIGGADALTTDQSKLTYSFNYGNDHFIVVNTDPVGKDGKTAYKWIASDIKAARNAGARHIFALGHKPAYSSPMKPGDGLETNLADRDSLWKYFEDYKCEAMFAAHEHLWDTIHPHKGKTWQVIAGNGGSLVETTWMNQSSNQGYFGYTVVTLYTNNEINLKSYGRDIDLTKVGSTYSRYSLDADNKSTTLRQDFNIGISPVINHTGLSVQKHQGPFTITATITDDISVTSAQLNYFVNGVSQTPITPSISGNIYTFTIPIQSETGVIKYNIQANDNSTTTVYSNGSSTRYNSFNFGSTIGVNSSDAPYLSTSNQNVTFKSILTVGNSASNGYKMAGIPDGLGAFDNGDGTFSLLMNHELGKTVGVNRAHGVKGSFVSKWIINKSDLSVISGSDLIQNVKLWNGTNYDTYNSLTPQSIPFHRLCSADLAPTSGLFNLNTSKGTQDKVFFSGEEGGGDDRCLAHIVTGDEAGTSYQLPVFGKMAFENALVNPRTSDKTVVALTSDGYGNQVFVYVGDKSNTGTTIEKAGLTTGKLYGVKVTGLPTETSASVPVNETAFTLVEITNPSSYSATQLQNVATGLGVTTFLRPEDAAWNPTNPFELFLNTTASITTNSRLWRLRFNSLDAPTGGTITAVLDGSEGQKMLDNMTVDNNGYIYLNEDPGNDPRLSKVWQYDIAKDTLVELAHFKSDYFLNGGANFMTQDEETSGIIDVQDILGKGKFLLVDQVHKTNSDNELVEYGQLLEMTMTLPLNTSAKVSSTKNSYILPVKSNVTADAVLTVGDKSNNGYRMVGIPDGLGAFDNGNGTFTLVMNHELGNTLGNTRAHGVKGAFVSKWTINKSNLSVISGEDLIKNVKLWNNTTSSFETYNSSNPQTVPFYRFCSADLPNVTALYNSTTKKGTTDRIYFSGEEGGGSDRCLAHIVTGSEAGTSYELPYFGKMAFENAVANPKASDKTIFALTSDGYGNQVFFYVGEKATIGSPIQKAGLLNGKLYGLKVTGLNAETSNSIPTAETNFTLEEISSVNTLSASALQTTAMNLGVTSFLRPEDAAWNPVNTNELFFNTTASMTTNSRLWKLNFTDIANPLLGGKITAVLDGSEGQKMMDNLTVDKFGNVYLQEDPGNNSHNARILQYNIAKDSLVVVAQHNPNIVTKGSNQFLTEDEETSGIVDMSDILGKGKFLLADQIHLSIGGELVEEGQLILMNVTDTIPNITTTIKNTSCGTTVTALNTLIYATPVASAQSYRFKIIKDSEIQIIERTVPYFSFSLLGSKKYGVGYNVSVSVKKYNIWHTYSEGCTISTPNIPLTSVKDVQCNTALTDLTTVVYLNSVLGATGYNVKITNGLDVQILTKTSPSFKLWDLTIKPTYNTNYKVEVAPIVNSEIGQYGNICTITTPNVPVISIKDAHCDAVIAALNTNIYATKTVLGATGYKFYLTGNSHVDSVITSSSVVNLTKFNNPLSRKYNQTYSIKVAPIINEVAYSYGNSCNILTGSIPSGTIKSTSCGKTLISLNTDYVYAEPIIGASQYRFVIQNGDYYDSITTTSSALVFSRFIKSQSKLVNTSYNVSVKGFVNGVWGSYGNSCLIKTPIPASITSNHNSLNLIDEIEVLMYPNPFTNTFNIRTELDGEVNIKIHDISGRAIQEMTVQSNELVNTKIGEDFIPGIYNVIVNQNNYRKTFRVLKVK